MFLSPSDHLRGGKRMFFPKDYRKTPEARPKKVIISRFLRYSCFEYKNEHLCIKFRWHKKLNVKPKKKDSVKYFNFNLIISYILLMYFYCLQ